MSRYTTIDATKNKDSLQQPIRNRVLANSNPEIAVDRRQVQNALISNNDAFLNANKSIIQIKLPKKPERNMDSFRSSLYESSLKRLKQQKVTIIKEADIPSISTNRTFQSLQEQLLKKAIREKNIGSKGYFPHVYRQVPHVHRQVPHVYRQVHGEQTKYPELKLANRQQHQSVQSKIYLTTMSNQKRSTLQSVGTILAIQDINYKELELRQVPLSSKRKSQLLQRHQNKRRSLFEEYSYHFETKYNMKKQILQNLNGHRKKDFFQTRINGFKTVLYPTHHLQLHRKKTTHISPKNKQDSHQVKEKIQVSRFLERRKLRNDGFHAAKQSPEVSFNLTNKQQKPNAKQSSTGEQNPELQQRHYDYTPWETDFANFD